ncbi:hypothetical protein A3844_03280 [Paenibacillus helianthi]|uniref:Uncharacterized protein n=1 Tax=Paenibacillus helianthi TaxID=1349432 RepID=A0ABX3EUU5_9BACL|nr:hypothetical protein [Paenibacillus helianthi]OKP90894.1 hypothetical protein A3844_03280 [Paenibacillus helianthi]
MSISASINIYLSERSRTNLSITDLFQNFENEGWNYINRNGEVTILPLGDDDDFEWTSTTLHRDVLFDILKKKREQREIIGIELFRVDSEVGCELLIFNTNQMMFSLSIARKKIKVKDAIDITDFSWYLDSIFPVFKNLQIEQIRCEQLL